MTTTDPREKNLLIWAQELVRGLRTQAELTATGLADVTAENVRLRGLVEGRYTTDDGSDTFLINQDTAQELPLGVGPDVRFGGVATVRCDKHTPDGSPSLIIETDNPMVVRLSGAAYMIHIGQENI